MTSSVGTSPRCTRAPVLRRLVGRQIYALLGSVRVRSTGGFRFILACAGCLVLAGAACAAEQPAYFTRYENLRWLFWQVGGLGPMAGQNHHFVQHAPEKLTYAIERYVMETARLYAVLDKRLANRQFTAGDYSIADMASYPWVVPHKRQQQDLDDVPHLKRWFDEIRARPAVARAYDKGSQISTQPVVNEASRKFLFGQSSVTVAR